MEERRIARYPREIRGKEDQDDPSDAKKYRNVPAGCVGIYLADGRMRTETSRDGEIEKPVAWKYAGCSGTGT